MKTKRPDSHFQLWVHPHVFELSDPLLRRPAGSVRPRLTSARSCPQTICNSRCAQASRWARSSLVRAWCTTSSSQIWYVEKHRPHTNADCLRSTSAKVDVLALRILGLLISQTVPDLATTAAAAKREAEGFVAATTFSGAKPGFIFKADVAGLGYYPDSSATK